VAADTRLALAGPTLGWVAAAIDVLDGFRQPSALKHLRFPIVVLSAGEEALVDNKSHPEIAAMLPNARHEVVEGAFHEILMETDDKRARFWAAFDSVADQVAPRAGVAQSA
jgi:lysophospholipase